jgi:cytochrome c5
MTVKIGLAVALCTLLISGCGKQEATAPAAATAPAPAPAVAPAVSVDAVGKSAYGKACALCHAAGVAGAPRPGDKADWAARMAQGNEVLYRRAIEGYTGAKGVMPPRGGSTLSDTEIRAAVDFMVAQSK